MKAVNKSLAQRWQIEATLLAMMIGLQTVGMRVGWAQDAAEPRLDDEIAKQEQVYRSRGANVPSRYVTNRGLSHYAELLPSGFCDTLGKLGGSDRWLDIGAGSGGAILDYYAPEGAAAPNRECGQAGAKASAVAMSIEDRRGDKWRQRAASLGGDRLRYLYGKPLRQYPTKELGKFHMITDVFGGFTYTEDLSRFVDKVLNLLHVGGGFYTLMAGVQLADGKDKLGTYYMTELVNPTGSRAKVCSWLKSSSCTHVTCESKSDWDMPTELIRVQKVCSDVAVPPLKLLEYRAGVPPERRFELAP